MKYFLSIFLLVFSTIILKAGTCDCTKNLISLCSLLHGVSDVNLVEAHLIKTDSLLDGYTVSWQFELIEEYGSKPFSTSDTFWVAYDIEDVCFKWFDLPSINLGDTLFFATPEKGDDNVHRFELCNHANFSKKGNQVIGNVNYRNYSYNDNEFRNYAREGYLTDFDCLPCSCLQCAVPGANTATNFCFTYRRMGEGVAGRFRVLERNGQQAKFEVIELSGFSSDLEGDTITIWGKKAENDCRATLDDFILGEEYILILRRISYLNRESLEEKDDEFEFTNCGVSILEIDENNRVTGQITENYNELSYQEFLNIFPEFYMGYPEETCEDVLLNLTPIINKITIKPYPNPATTKVIFEFDQSGVFDPIFIYDTNGQIVKKMELNGFEKTVQMDVKDLPSNLYFWKIGDQSGKLFVK